MNLRHAAALALTGWYLLMPPIQGWKEAGGIGPPPLGVWTQDGEFDTAAECKQALEKSLKFDPLGRPLKGPPTIEMLSQRCIATDDPRLKEKQVQLPGSSVGAGRSVTSIAGSTGLARRAAALRASPTATALSPK
jgi:hypothetical protein